MVADFLNNDLNNSEPLELFRKAQSRMVWEAVKRSRSYITAPI